MQNATYSIQEDGSYVGEIAQLPDVWSHAKTLENCRQSLQEVLEAWLVLALSTHQFIPVINGASLDSEDNELTEEEWLDLHAALEKAKHEGTVPWEVIKAELGKHLCKINCPLERAITPTGQERYV